MPSRRLLGRRSATSSPSPSAVGNRAELRGLNIIGMKRSGLSTAGNPCLRKAYRMIFDRTQPLARTSTAPRREFADVAERSMQDHRFHAGARQTAVRRASRAAALDDDGADDEAPRRTHSPAKRRRIA